MNAVNTCRVRVTARAKGYIGLGLRLRLRARATARVKGYIGLRLRLRAI